MSIYFRKTATGIISEMVTKEKMIDFLSKELKSTKKSIADKINKAMVDNTLYHGITFYGDFEAISIQADACAGRKKYMIIARG